MNYSAIKRLDVANGTGIRVSLFVSGCPHHCRECFNPETWDEAGGEPFTREVEDKILKFLEPDHVAGLTLLGGEPMTPDHQQVLLPFLERVKERFPEKTIWVYTGYRLDDEILGKMYPKYEFTRKILNLFDIMVDGRFVIEKKNIRLRFRGSENQRIIDVKKTIETGQIITDNELMGKSAAKE